MLLLDTHVLLWLDAGVSSLPSSVRLRADRALAADKLVVSAISFWEVAMLVAKKRVQLPSAAGVWRLALLNAGLRELPVQGDLGIEAAQLNMAHGDPADRLIIATARHHEATLVTADQRILACRLCRTLAAI